MPSRNASEPTKWHISLTEPSPCGRCATGIGAGLQHHMAGARKFGVEHIDRTDICSSQPRNGSETGIPFITEQDDELARRIVLG